MTTPRTKSALFPSVLYQARFNPHAIAVAFGNQEVSYADFARDIERATRQLAHRMATRPNLAMVALTHPYLHWVLTIALARLGITSVTAYDVQDQEMLARVKPDVVFVNPNAAITDPRCVAVKEEWLGVEADALPAFVDGETDGAAPFRMVLSSGTTGIPKKILLSFEQFQQRLQALALGSLMTGHRTRSLVLVGFDTIGGLQFPMATWHVGGRVVLLMGGDDPYRTIVRQGVNYAFMAPVQLEQMLGAMPAAAWPLQDLTVSVAGSAISRQLADRARARLTPNLLSIYGSTEAGLIAVLHTASADALPGASGVVRPEVEVQIVDANGAVLPPGTVGEVRSWGRDTITGYFDAEGSGADNAEIFRDGWFYPGDAGVLSADGVLTIVGRIKELMNFGGVKLTPNAVEDALRGCPGVVDLAAFALDQDGGVATPWVAVVRGEGYEQAALAARFKEVFPRLPAVKFVHADIIPRNAMGKIMRGAIVEGVRRSLEQAGA